MRTNHMKLPMHRCLKALTKKILVLWESYLVNMYEANSLIQKCARGSF